MTPPLLEVDALRKRLGNTDVLNGVGFELAEGECIALLGASGCGKTTTLRCIAGLEQPDTGRILLAGRALNGAGRPVPPQRREMGMVFQSYSVWPHLTVFENVAFGLRLSRHRRGEIAERVRRSLRMMAIEHLAERRSAQLSGGQLQRVALARTLVTEPKLVLFDEPLSNLDTRLRVQMRDEIRALLRRLGMSAVYVTHDQAEAVVVADRIAVMHRGRVEQIGDWDTLYASPASAHVAEFIGGMEPLPGTVASAGVDGAVVRVLGIEVVLGQGGLEPGSGVALFVPREAVGVVAAGAGDCGGRIASVLPGPGVTECVVQMEGGARLTAMQLDPPGWWQAGAPCGVTLDAGRIRVVPEQQEASR